MAKKQTPNEQDLISALQNYRSESKQAKQERMAQNKTNFDSYHLRQDFSEKMKGQSREFLPNMAMAVEQSANFLQQGLVDIGDWFKVYPMPGMNEDKMKVKPGEIRKLTERQLKLDGFVGKVADFAKLGLIGSLMIAKVRGKWVEKPKYKAKTTLKDGKFTPRLVKQVDKVWQLEIDMVRQEDYYPDPTGEGLYEMQDIYMDYWQVEQLATGKNAIYDLSVVKQLRGQPGDSSGTTSEYNKAREAGQDSTNSSYRRRIKLTEVWGNILSNDGELLYENVVCTMANDTFIIQKPTPNPNWHGQSPFITAPILSVPHGVWGKALMDAPTMLNKASNEMFNLMLDGGMAAVHGIKQLRPNWLEDPSQVEEGIPPGTTLLANSACPPGMTVLERVDTSTIPQDGMQIFNLLKQEFNTAALTNDMRMGVQPFRAVKATEVVESSQAITSMFSGIATNIEDNFLAKILDLSWKTIAQNMSDMDSDEITSLCGADRAQMLSAMSNESLFAETVMGCKFAVFGISATLNKQKDFSKLQGFLQTISTSPSLMEEFNKKYSMTKLLTEIMRSLDIETDKLEADEAEGGDLSQPQQPGQVPGGQGPGAPMPNAQSQIPQAGAPNNQTDQKPETNIPQAQFPTSRANPRGGFVPGQGAA